MKARYIILLLIAVMLIHGQCTMNDTPSHPFAWDTPGNASSPWTRWWWFGSGVSEAELTRQLEILRENGFGGVEIQPIYAEDPSTIPPIPYLSERWAEVFAYTLKEAERLGLGVDLTLGSGWPFGGPWLEPGNAARKLDIERIEYGAAARDRSIGDTEDRPIESVILADGGQGTILEPVTAGGRKTWQVPEGDHTVYILRIGFTGQEVKRATVGSEGPVLDHFSKSAFANYVQPFEKVLSRTGGLRPRSNFNDSYEVYGADCTPGFFETFEMMHGYDLRPLTPSLLSGDGSELNRKLLHDYRETIYHLFMNGFCLPWKEWTHDNGMRIKFQAHGCPGNLIDLYGLSDIPETEGFGRFGIRLIEGKFSSSAAHLYDRELCSSETFTWLDEHFHVSLDMMKRAVDDFYLAGITHIFYHGTPFSPKSDPYPGPVFYASTHAGETNTWWPHVKYFNEYMRRIQAPLQRARFDPDVALYFPVHDSWRFASGHGVEFDSVGKSVPTGKGSLLQLCEVNRSEHWFQEPAPLTWKTANLLQAGGWQYDYISDKVLSESGEAADGKLSVNSMKYRAVIFAGSREVEESTLKKITRLLADGVTVIFIKNFPAPVDRRTPSELSSQRENPYAESLKPYLNTTCFLLDSVDELPAFLESREIKPEHLPDEGILFIRYKNDDGTLYFVKNPGAGTIRKNITLRSVAREVVLADPLAGSISRIRCDAGRDGVTIELVMEPYASLLLLVTEKRHADIPERFSAETESPIAITTPWKVMWKDYHGVTHSRDIDRLESWTAWKESALYSGEMTYENVFTVSGEKTGKRFVLHTGKLCNSAAVTVNGRPAGAIWTEPFTLDITDCVGPGQNSIRLDVINLMANRIIEMDRKGEEWRNYFFVNIDYETFDASNWNPLPSGLLGPVSISIHE